MEEKKEGKKEENIEQKKVVFTNLKARLTILKGDFNEATRGVKEIKRG